MLLVCSWDYVQTLEIERGFRMKAIKGRRSYTFHDPKFLYMELGTEVFGDHLEYEVLNDLYTDEEIEDMGYEEIVEIVARATEPSKLIETLQRQGYFIETSGIEYTGIEQGLIDETSIFNYALNEWLEELSDIDTYQVSYKGKLIDLLFMLVDIPTSLYTNTDFMKEIDNRYDSLDQEYELVFSLSDSGIEWELV